MSLLREIQDLLERTYASTGVNLEHFLIDRRRSEELARLAGAGANELSPLGRVYLRPLSGNLHLGMYYSSSVISQLENHHPNRCGLNDENIEPFIIFVEEINHALHAILRFMEGHSSMHEETFARELELQAKIDTYFVLAMFRAYFRENKKLTPQDKEWIRHWLFERESFEYQDPVLKERYIEINFLGRKFLSYLDSLRPPERLGQIRFWRGQHYPVKKDFIMNMAG